MVSKNRIRRHKKNCEYCNERINDLWILKDRMLFNDRDEKQRVTPNDLDRLYRAAGIPDGSKRLICRCKCNKCRLTAESLSQCLHDTDKWYSLRLNAWYHTGPQNH